MDLKAVIGVDTKSTFEMNIQEIVGEQQHYRAAKYYQGSNVMRVTIL
jgi:hypothetical protein